jgi:hypothetical protein
VGAAAALEAKGVTTGDEAILAEARSAWEALGRPVDAERIDRLVEAVTS